MRGAAALAALLLLLAGPARALLQTCPVNCTCAQGLQLEYSCVGLEAVLQPGDFLRVECVEPSALQPAGELPALGDPSLSAARLAACLPPRAGWAAALRALRATNVTRLVLRAPDHTDRTAGGDTYWRSEHFAGLGALDALTLEGGGAVDGALLALLRVQRLTLRHVRLAGDALPLPAGAALRQLELGNVSLVELPERAFASAPDLRVLVVWGGGGGGGGGGAVRAAPGALAGLARLSAVQLRAVPLDTVPGGWLGALPTVRTVRVERCALRAVPADLLWGAGALSELSLAGNRLVSLPAQLLRDAVLLQRLELQNNALVSLPAVLLAPARALLRLDLSNNNLTQILQSTFSSQSELQTLNLNHNNLTFGDDPPADPSHPAPPAGAFGSFSPPSPLAPLRALRVLQLAYNHITTVYDDWRLNLPRLHRIDLSHNRLHTLTDADVNFVIGGDDTLELDLRYNNISLVLLSGIDPAELDQGAARAAGGPPPPATRVLLAGNPLHCDCQLHELLRRAAPRGAFDLEHARCAAPPALLGRPLDDALQTELACTLPAPACPPACVCALRPGLPPGLLTLACPAPPLASVWPAPADYGLSASALRLTVPPRAAPALPPHCRLLDLTALNLTRLPPGLGLGDALDRLDLRDNLLDELPAGLLADTDGTRLLLRGNPLQCGCAHAGALARLQRASARVEDWAALRCADGAPLSRARVAPCAVLPWPALAALGALAAVLAVLAGVLTLRYSRELRGWAAARGLACCWPADPAGVEADEGVGKRYDAFVSYAHGDERWVVSELVPRLERAGLRLCLHFRDWAAGGWIPAQIERSVRESRRTLLVVSAHYLASEWGQHEWRAALSQPKPRLVLVLLDSLPADGAGLAPELRAHMQRHTYVRVGDPWFWSKLRVALPRRSVAPASPAERRRRDVTKKLTFDDRLEALCAAPPRPHPAAPDPAAAQRALLARLDPATLEV